VVLIARGSHADAIDRHGLVVEDAEGRRVVKVPVVTDPAAAGISKADVVLLGMKSQDTAAALDVLRRVASSSTSVACLQNGVENERAALRYFDRVYGVCVLCPAGHLQPGVVRAYSFPIPGLLDVGRFPAGTDEMSAAICQALEDAKFNVIERPDIMRWKYRKLLMNLGNAVEALCGPGARSEIRRLAQEEGERCLKGARIDFASAEDDRARRGDLMKLYDVGGEPRGGGSTWQSLRRGTGSIEADFLNGEVVLLGRLHGIPTPVNALLQKLVWEAAVNMRQPGSMEPSELVRRLRPFVSPGHTPVTGPQEALKTSSIGGRPSI
jgi:2-dehydropantoate 2-reductase